MGYFAQPRGVAVDDSTGNVYVADPYNNRFQTFGPDGSFMGSWGKRNSIAPYGFDYPRGLAYDNTLDRVWVLNTRAHNIRRYNADSSYIDTLGSEPNDSAAPGYFRWPVTADFNNGYAYIGDYNSGVVKRLNANTGAEINQKSLTNNGVAVDASTGNVYVVSWSTDKVTVLSPDLSTMIRSWGSTGSGDGQFQNPWGITVVNGVVYVTDVQLSRIQAFDLNGNFLGKWGGYGAGPYQFANPSGITHDAAGNLYVADSANDRIQIYSTTVAQAHGRQPQARRDDHVADERGDPAGRDRLHQRHRDRQRRVRRREGGGRRPEHDDRSVVELEGRDLGSHASVGHRGGQGRLDHEHDVFVRVRGSGLQQPVHGDRSSGRCLRHLRPPPRPP